MIGVRGGWHRFCRCRLVSRADNALDASEAAGCRGAKVEKIDDDSYAIEDTATAYAARRKILPRCLRWIDRWSAGSSRACPNGAR
jgi:hypothetical protein